jgi:predicted transcriptional regulator/ferredoxin
MEIIQVLERLGFTEYEARAYVTLLQYGPLNGYELAREAKLPRANVYAVLEKLENRGIVTRLESPSGTRYAPIPPKELTQRLGDQMHEYLTSAEDQLGSLHEPLSYEYIWNAHGYPALIEHAKFLVEGAQNSLLIALSPQESLILKNNLESAERRGVDITTLCMEACQVECGHCKGRVLRYQLAPEESSRWLMVVMDGVELLAGEISAGDDAQSVRTRQRLLVEMTAGYIRRSIALVVLLNDLSGQQAEFLTPQAQAALQAIDPAHGGGSWLDSLRRLIRKDPRQPGNAELPSLTA